MPLANPIELSFELAAECCDDLTPLVYTRLHREHPETRAMFRTEGSELVKGSMLSMTIDVSSGLLLARNRSPTTFTGTVRSCVNWNVFDETPG